MIFAPPSAPVPLGATPADPTPTPTPAPRLGPLHGLIGAQLRYVARLAQGMDPRLGLGNLVAITTNGSRSVTAVVSFDEGGECRMRGRVAAEQVDATPAGTALVGPGADAATAVTACLTVVHDLPGLGWGALVRQDRTVVAGLGDPLLDTLPDVGVRSLGILGGLEAHHREECVWLSFEHRNLVIAPVGAACLVLCPEPGDPATALEALTAVRVTLAAVDLDRVQPLDAPFRPPAPETAREGDEPDAPDDWDDEVPLTGARFAGATGAVPRERRHRQSR